MCKWHLIYIILYALHVYVIISLLTEEDLNAYNMMKNNQQSAPEYKHLITIHAGKPKGDIQDELKAAGAVRRLSLSEQALEKASESYGADIVRQFSNSGTW